MKHFILKIVAFSTLFIISYSWFVIRNSDNAPIKNSIRYPLRHGGFLYSRLQDIKHTNDVDIMFAGSSHAYRGFDTRFFQNHGYSCINTGSSNQTTMQTQLIFENYLQQLSPRLIILEVCPELMAADGVESTTDFIAHYGVNFSTVRLAVRTPSRTSFHTLIYGWWAEKILHDKENFIEGKTIGNDTYIDGGYVQKDAAPMTNCEITEPLDYQIGKSNLSSLIKCVAMAKLQGSKILLVSSPVAKSQYESYCNYENFVKTISSIANYVDYNNKIPLPDSLFYDRDHMLQEGVDLFNNVVICDVDKILGDSLYTRQ